MTNYKPVEREEPILDMIHRYADRLVGPKQRAWIAERLLKPEKYDRIAQFKGVAATVRTARSEYDATRERLNGIGLRASLARLDRLAERVGRR